MFSAVGMRWEMEFTEGDVEFVITNGKGDNVQDGEKTVSKSGASSSKVPRMDLIPYSALVRLANRFALGLEKHGKNNYRKGLSDKDYVIERLGHVINHAYRLIEKLEGRLVDEDDDAAAIAWGGIFACLATESNLSNSSNKHECR